ncbi:MAG: hypothetical protein IIA41_14365, partial [SAR324 cluster bacterium]|nr:hypothetical protein [SAR324 cluster bacterium]
MEPPTKRKPAAIPLADLGASYSSFRRGGVMGRCMAVLLAALMALPFGVLAQDRPIAALGRVAVLGEISEGQRKIITNRVRA